jgi:hypothetical protein
MIALFLILACQPDQMMDPLAQAEVAVEVNLAAKQVSESEAVLVEVVLSSKAGWTAGPVDLVVDKLDVERLPAEVVETDSGEREVHQFSLTGPSGSYVLEPVEIEFSRSDGESRKRESARLFFDVGPEGLRSELEGFAELPPLKENPWPKRFVWAGLGFLLAAALLFWWWKRPRKPVPVLPPIPPDQEALAAWAIVWNDPDLDDHGRALLLSQIFRRYVERVFQLPASAFTSMEVLDQLSSDLSEHHLGQSRRLLGATDRIKYARRGGGQALFESLDTDFRELIEATKPAPVEEAADD